jgi:hypothetical protein
LLMTFRKSAIRRYQLRCRFVRSADLEARAKNPPFWHACKKPRLMLPQNPFKIQAVVEDFWLSRDSGHP